MLTPDGSILFAIILVSFLLKCFFCYYICSLGAFKEIISFSPFHHKSE
ncbi:MAG: 4Fe-4S binding protein [Eggerthellaceae bacterium]|nr:4Fe-4S binding protein [Eggerthellaceae bacterium]